MLDWCIISIHVIIISKLNYGWLIKSIHRWSSGVMVLIQILHIIRVYLTGGFKRPREFIWITGVFLAMTIVSFGVTGYSFVAYPMQDSNCSSRSIR